MSLTLTLEPAGAQQLQELYTRYKALALSTSAALLLDGELGPIAERVEELLEECRIVCGRRDVHRLEAAACAEAAASLPPAAGWRHDARGARARSRLAPAPATRGVGRHSLRVRALLRVAA